MQVPNIDEVQHLFPIPRYWTDYIVEFKFSMAQTNGP